MASTKLLYERTCACGCGERFSSPRHDKRFASDDCRAAYHNRRICQGMKIIDPAIRWRKERSKGSFTDMCAVLDQIISEDKTKGVQG